MTTSVEMTPGSAKARESLLTIFLVFLRLGLTSFGGPVAHLGYFRAEFVERRKWLADEIRKEEAITPAVRAAIVKWYGRERGEKIQSAEAFEVCEYGRQPNEADLRKLFPMLGH